MPKFNFVVKDPSGKTIQGTITMDRKDQLIDRLRDQGYYINRITDSITRGTACLKVFLRSSSNMELNCSIPLAHQFL